MKCYHVKSITYGTLIVHHLYEAFRLWRIWLINYRYEKKYWCVYLKSSWIACVCVFFNLKSEWIIDYEVEKSILQHHICFTSFYILISWLQMLGTAAAALKSTVSFWLSLVVLQWHVSQCIIKQSLDWLDQPSAATDLPTSLYMSFLISRVTLDLSFGSVCCTAVTPGSYGGVNIY